ncbi:metalloprotease [Coprinopsis sp. MPI-PUGE-AT-0042]|nr:metalloprotease [Coprinopsis sp. MPI-PUGE-AT-0042]
MLKLALLSFVLGVATVLAAPPTRLTCGTEISTEQTAANEAHFRAHGVAPNNSLRREATLNVYFHVVASNNSSSGGYISTATIASQMDILNEAYGSTGISWKLANTTYTINDGWYRRVGPRNSEQRAMKAALRQGGKADLNVPQYSPLGIRYLSCRLQPKCLRTTVCVLNDKSLPGGSDYGNNYLGYTLVHEAGHWLGLYHPFNGGDCSGNGDYVDDTPAEAKPSFGCPKLKDTCPGGGPDPIHNFMDYSDDSCLTEFTPGQVERIRAQIATYRGVEL